MQNDFVYFKTLNTMIIDNFKKADIVRELTFALKTQNKDTTNRRITSEVCNKFDNLNRNISKRLNKIIEFAPFAPLRITVLKSTPSYPYLGEGTPDVLSNISDVESLRILINFEPYNTEIMTSKILAQNISHLVEISFLPEDSSCEINQEGSSCATVYVSSSIDKAFKIIEDVMLDISMFNTLIDPKGESSIETRRAFSKIKIDFVNRFNLHSDCWNTQTHKGYVAIAGYFWNKDYFDYKGYINCWLRIKQELFNEKEITPIVYSLDEQLKRNADAGELPMRSIRRLYNKLPEGEYILVRLYKIPKLKVVQESLRCLLGGKIIKRGKVKIYLKKDIHIFDKYRDYVKIFPLYK